MRSANLRAQSPVNRQSFRKLAAVALLNALTMTGAAWAAPPERPTFNHTGDPRPNILPNWIYTHHVPYRLQYNRPTYYGGKIAYHISRTSQEAMVWEENLAAGRYDGHHCPPVYKRYMYPKPWEALNTQPRPSFATASVQTPVNMVEPIVDPKANSGSNSENVVPSAPSPSDKQ